MYHEHIGIHEVVLKDLEISNSLVLWPITEARPKRADKSIIQFEELREISTLIRGYKCKKCNKLGHNSRSCKE
ncbi:hypothetical protein AYI69_g11058 [Smittium culicis]|uniref:CCHC-type domain-containing protein n=1 Tax=Smittium culicis TaxID=133412 RepID=A0A1R1X1C4_9FUNG|nr:hypothetical protein AYI69_g11058 [Smittium culicis]